MDIGGIGLLKLAGSRLDYLAQRHRVIAENVTNANTPGYIGKDLRAFEALLDGPKAVAPARTNPVHLAGSRQAESVRAMSGRNGRDMTPDGNGVSLEQEMIKASETREAYTLAAGIYQKHVGMLRAAWSGRGA